MSKALVPYEGIENKIYFIRGQKVMLDRELASLYGVPTKVFNQAVKRNIRRFPDDFMFQLTPEEALALRSQIVTSNIERLPPGRGGRRYLPFAFTEQGIAMLSSVLYSERAIDVNIAIMRAFVRLRHFLSIHKELAQKIELLEKRVFKHDTNIRELVRDIRKMTIERPTRKHKVGFFKE